MSLKIHAQTSFYANTVEFWIFDEINGERRAFAGPVKMEVREQDGLMVAPTFGIPLDNAQQLFEELWAQGFRSAHDKGNAEALDAARKEHIADLRKAAKLG